MRPDQLEKLQAQHGAAAARLQALLDTPQAERPKEPKALRAWLQELRNARAAVEQLDRIIHAAQPRPPRTRPAPIAPPPASVLAPQDELLLAAIPKSSNGAELRVYVKTWQGRRTIDLRVYVQRSDGTVTPTRKGVQFDVKRLDAVMEALRLAAQHV